ncbi:MAG: ABC transporter ATP-binding protein [Spirochaetales bacterium]|nr:ABC transporter ATP-binding protein [Spirochaetales bacterium]
MEERNKVLEVKNLKTWFHTFKGVVKAVDDVSFELYEKEILGIVGESGGGKSITGFSIINMIDEPGIIETGEILFEGRNIVRLSEGEMNKIRGKKISMIFQDPMTSLNPVYTIGKQLEEILILHESLSKKERRNRCIELLKAVGISNAEKRLKNYPHEFSGGMRQRVVIAIALASNPKIIIADEPTTALDVTIQAQILRLMKKLVRENNCALILITHDLAVIAEMADRVNVMYCGKIVESGYTRDIIFHHLHPYTQGLIGSIPGTDTEKKRLTTIEGVVPNMFDLPKGCKFAPRCAYRQPVCFEEEPEIRDFGDNHRAACFFPVREGAV